MAASQSPEMTSKHSVAEPPTLPGIHTLLTPPNSGNTGDLKHTFEAEPESDVIFSQDSFSSPQRPLFTPQIPPELERKLEEEERSYIKHWMEENASSWDDWEQRTGVPRPRENEYHLTWSFYRDFHQGEDQLPQLTRTLRLTINDREVETLPAQKKRKVLQDTSPNRRGAASLAPKLPAGAQVQRPKPASIARSPAHSRKKSGKPQEDGSPEPRSKAARAKATKPETSHNFRDYPDWTPRAFEIPNALQHAQAVRKFSGGYNDLSNDPHRDLILPEEVVAAEHLSLNCAKYLCAKRQIFKGYVDHLAAKARNTGHDKPSHNNWNKTAVQQLGNVDVNKMSALFTFFKDVGWFKEHLFAPFVDEVLRNGSPSPS